MLLEEGEKVGFFSDDYEVRTFLGQPTPPLPPASYCPAACEMTVCVCLHTKFDLVLSNFSSLRRFYQNLNNPSIINEENYFQILCFEEDFWNSQHQLFNTFLSQMMFSFLV